MNFCFRNFKKVKNLSRILIIHPHNRHSNRSLRVFYFVIFHEFSLILFQFQHSQLVFVIHQAMPVPNNSNNVRTTVVRQYQESPAFDIARICLFVTHCCKNSFDCLTFCVVFFCSDFPVYLHSLPCFYPLSRRNDERGGRHAEK